MAIEITSFTTNVTGATIKKDGLGYDVGLPTGTTTVTPTIAVTSGASVSPASGTAVTTIPSTVTYTVSKQGETDVVYTVAYHIGTDDSNKVENIQHVGWFAARCFTGTIDTYDAGGIGLTLGNFKPKFVVSVVIDGGFTGFYNISTNKLKVYKKANGEATTADLNGTKYSVILME